MISSDLSFNWYAHFIYSRCRVRVASAEGFPLDYTIVKTQSAHTPWVVEFFVILTMFFAIIVFSVRGIVLRMKIESGLVKLLFFAEECSRTDF